MSNLAAIYVRRKRQIVVVLMMGAFAVMMAVMYAKMLPTYSGLMPATDGETLYLGSRAWVPEASVDPQLVLSRSADGTEFSAPDVRSGVLQGLAANAGRVYALFHDGSTLSLGKRADDWSSVRWDAEWTPLGLAAADNSVYAFGQSDDRKQIVAAMLDNETWKPAPGTAHSGDNAVWFTGARSRGVDYVAWVEIVSPADAAGRKLSPLEAAMLPQRLWLARAEGGTLTPLAPFDFGKPVSVTVVGDDAGVHVYYQDVLSVQVDGATLAPALRVATYADGAWGAPGELPASGATWRRPGEFTAASFRGKTFLYAPEYFLGTVYVGTWGRELRGNETSQPFEAMAPTNQDLAMEIRWALMAVAAVFVLSGAASAFVRTRHFVEPAPTGPVVPASVTDRGMAAMLDLGIVYWVLQLLMGEADAVSFWVTVAATYLVYGAVLEAAAGGQTLAKRLLGLRVVDASTGGPAGFSAALARNMLKLAEMITVGAGMVLSTRRFQRLGDLLAGTVVVKEFPRVAPAE